jgi:AcrR family transcriptional regulator
MTTAKSAVRPSARERLLNSANELFYAEGVQSVGIDRIIEHAGVAKASLYNTFGGKEQLIRAYLDKRHEVVTERITRTVARYEDPAERLLAVFEAQGVVFGDPDYHGCPFVAASVEASPDGLIQEATDTYRAWLRALFAQLSQEAGAADPESLARQLHLVYDGAHITARMDHDPTAAQTARAAATALIAAATGACG